LASNVERPVLLSDAAEWQQSRSNWCPFVLLFASAYCLSILVDCPVLLSDAAKWQQSRRIRGQTIRQLDNIMQAEEQKCHNYFTAKYAVKSLTLSMSYIEASATGYDESDSRLLEKRIELFQVEVV